MSHYDREVDIASLDLEGFPGSDVYGEDHEWGLVLRERRSRRVVGFEVWGASKRLPAELLDALPEPKGEGVVIEGQSARR